MQVFVIINKDGMKINADVIAKNWLCYKGFIWNTSYCECECDKSCDVGKYLYHTNCKCWKRLADKWVDECPENIDEKELYPTELHSDKMIYNSTLNDYKKACSSCTIYIEFLLYFS